MKDLLKMFCSFIISSYCFGQCKADAGPDIVNYNGKMQKIGGAPSAIAAKPTTFTYKWEPMTGLICDSNCANPSVYNYTNDTVIYKLTIVDETTKCFSTDRVTVISIIDNIIEIEKKTYKNSSDTSQFTFPDIEPEYPGGLDSMAAFLARNITYPKDAVEMGIQGKCFISFVICENGEICEAKIMKNVTGCPECDAEALRVVQLMPNWIPAQKDGENIKVKYMIPINYMLTNHKNRRSKK